MVNAHEQKEKQRLDQLLEQIDDKVENRDFKISVEWLGNLSRTISATGIAQFLNSKLDTEDPDAVAKTYENQGVNSLPRWTYSPDNEDLTLTFQAIPLKKSARKSKDRIIGTEGPGKAEYVQNDVALKKSISKKASQYGYPDIPYVLSVNVLTFSLDQMDISNALFGKEKHQILEKDKQTFETIPFRERNGVWVDSEGPINTRLSAVLVGFNVIPWNLPKIRVRLIHNPWAENPYDGPLTKLDQIIPTEKTLDFRKGINLLELLSLPTEW